MPRLLLRSTAGSGLAGLGFLLLAKALLAAPPAYESADPAAATPVSGEWTEISTFPSYVTGTQAIDTRRHRLIVFDGDFTAWAMPLEGKLEWAKLSQAGPRPSGSAFHTAIYDEEFDRCILFGGDPARVWSLQLSDGTWNEIIPVNPGPSSRSHHSAMYDRASGLMIVWGGAADDVTPWTLALSGRYVWTRLDPGGNPPQWAPGMSAVFDSNRNRLLVFSNIIADRNLRTWALPLSDPLNWEELPTGQWELPGYTVGTETFRTGYDPVHDQAVIFLRQWFGSGIYSHVIYVLHLSDSFPSWRFHQEKTYKLSSFACSVDPISGRLIVYGEADRLYGQSLRHVLNLTLSGSPQWGWYWSSLGYRIGPVMAYDEKAERMLFYGGNALEDGVYGIPPYEKSVWQLDSSGGTTWSRTSHSAGPELSESEAVVHPGLGGLLILAGARSSSISCQCFVPSIEDVFPPQNSWLASLSAPLAWTPFPRLPDMKGHTAIYDQARDRIVVLGGKKDTYVCVGGCNWVSARQTNDNILTWSPSRPSTWDVLPLRGGPGALVDHSAIYDPVRQQMIVFGGITSSGSLSDLWTCSLGDRQVWRHLTPSGSAPQPRSGHIAVYDPLRDRMVILGGAPESDVWALNLSAEPAWERLAPIGVPPSGLKSFAGAYDPVRDAVVVYGSGRTRLLSWGDPLLTVSVDVKPGDNQNRISGRIRGVLPVAFLGSQTFDVTQIDDSSLTLTVRNAVRASSAIRAAVRDVNEDGLADKVVFLQMTGFEPAPEDSIVTLQGRMRTGGRLRGWDRVRWVGERMLEPASRTVATQVLSMTVPANPVRGTASLDLSVPGEESAFLELIDIAGRLVATRQVVPATGIQRIEWPALSKAANGMYFVRLSQTGKSVTRKVAVAR